MTIFCHILSKLEICLQGWVLGRLFSKAPKRNIWMVPYKCGKCPIKFLSSGIEVSWAYFERFGMFSIKFFSRYVQEKSLAFIVIKFWFQKLQYFFQKNLEAAELVHIMYLRFYPYLFNWESKVLCGICLPHYNIIII